MHPMVITENKTIKVNPFQNNPNSMTIAKTIAVSARVLKTDGLKGKANGFMIQYRMFQAEGQATALHHEYDCGFQEIYR